MNFKNWKIRTKLILGFGIVVFLCLAVGIVGLYGLNQVHHKSENLAKIKDIQKGFVETRLYLRTFSALKDTQFYDRSSKSMTRVIGKVDTLKSLITITENKQLLQELQSNLNEYAALMVTNKKLILLQLYTAEKINNQSDNFLAELKSLGIQQSNPIHYLFAIVRINAANIQLRATDEFYQSAKQNIQLIIEEATRLRKPTLVSEIEEYATSIDQLIDIAKQNKELDPQQLLAGKKALESADRMSKITDDYVNETKQKTSSFLVIFIISAIIMGIGISFYITRYLSTMLGKGVKLAEVYAAGELTFKVPEEDLALEDEMGDLARAMVTMGNKMKEVVGNISSEAYIVSTASRQINSTTQQLSEGANEQASSVEEVSSSMEQMVANIQQNTQNASQAEKIIIVTAQKIREVATATQNSLDSARKITGKIGIINDIAFQTNILALNAAVEAARAGDQGKGFAVVAAEVRKLAEHSKIAAGEIVALTKISLKATEEAEALMMEVLPEIEKNSMLVKEIASASIEQNAGSDQINNAIQQLNSITQQNAASAEELASNADELAREAEHLNQATSYFKVEKSVEIKTNYLPQSKITKNLPSTKRIVTNTVPDKKKPKPNSSIDKGIRLDLNSGMDDNLFEKY